MKRKRGGTIRMKNILQVRRLRGAHGCDRKFSFAARGASVLKRAE
jgi:hypothetical protein